MSPITLIVKSQPAISGVVVDTKGKPLGGIRLAAIHNRFGVGWGVSRSDGSFDLVKFRPCPDRVRVTVSDYGPCEPRFAGVMSPWGKRGLRVVLTRLRKEPFRKSLT